jgi:hypothetical protein
LRPQDGEFVGVQLKGKIVWEAGENKGNKGVRKRFQPIHDLSYLK